MSNDKVAATFHGGAIQADELVLRHVAEHLRDLARRMPERSTEFYGWADEADDIADEIGGLS